MISLLWLGIFLNFIQIFIPTIVLWVNKIFVLKNNSQMSKLKDDIKSLKEEQCSISIVDEFAKHARLSRKIKALQSQLEKETAAVKETCSTVQFRISTAFSCILLILIVFKSSDEVISLPRQWMLPYSYFSESIGFRLWLAITYFCMTKIRSVLSS